MSATTDKDSGAAVRPRLLLGQSTAKNLIVGEIVEENLFPYPAIRSRDREMLGQIVEAIDNFLEDKAADFRRWDREGAQPAEFIQSLRELGLFSLIIPEEYGGLALSNAAYARVLAQTSSYDSSVVAHDRRAQLDRDEGHPALRHAGAEGSATCRGSRPAS